MVGITQPKFRFDTKWPKLILISLSILRRTITLAPHNIRAHTFALFLGVFVVETAENLVASVVPPVVGQQLSPPNPPLRTF